MSLNESTVEAAALGRPAFAKASADKSGSWALRPGTGLISRPVGRRRSRMDLAMWCWWAGRLRQAIHRLNPKIREETREDGLRQALRVAELVRTQLLSQ